MRRIIQWFDNESIYASAVVTGRLFKVQRAVPSFSKKTVLPKNERGAAARCLNHRCRKSGDDLFNNLQPRQTPEVVPVQPLDVDEFGKQCSASTMNSSKIANYLQGTVLPFAFLVAPAMTQLACAGADRRPAPAQEPEDEEPEGGLDPYEQLCQNQQRHGAKCPSRADWYKSFGYCPDGTEGCQ